MHILHLALAFVTVSSYVAPAIAKPLPQYSTLDECNSNCAGGYCSTDGTHTCFQEPADPALMDPPEDRDGPQD